MDTSVGVIYMNIWYVVTRSKSETQPLNVFSPRIFLGSHVEFCIDPQKDYIIWKVLYGIEEKILLFFFISWYFIIHTHTLL